jgi:AraC-like DNA-binding protein
MNTSLAVARGVEAFLREQRTAGTLYRELRPAPDLAAVVACGWVRVVRHDAGPQPLPVVPDGCADIITCDDGAPVVVGPDTRARSPALADGAVITGLRLRPGALRAVIGCRGVDLVDTSVRLDDITVAAQRLNSELEQWVRTRWRSKPGDLAVIHGCRMLAAEPAGDVADVSAALGWNARRLHREFTAACGYGPKTMQRILRIQHVMRTAHRARQPLRLSDMAASGGFADQAHMTREFRSITGLTPTHYLVRSDPALGRWLDADWSA